MVKCSDTCNPCCAFCIYVKRSLFFINNKCVKATIEGCKKHSDEHHQSMAQGLGYCKDFYCINAREKNNGT